MAFHSRIYNVTRGYYLKPNRAIDGVQNCVYAWVKFGISVRDLTLAESIARRSKLAEQCQPLPWAELPDCLFRPPAESSLWSARGSAKLCRVTNYFAISQPEFMLASQ